MVLHFFSFKEGSPIRCCSHFTSYLSYDYFIFSSLLFICSKLNFGRLAGWTIAELTPWETILELDQHYQNIGPIPVPVIFIGKLGCNFLFLIR